MAVNKSYIITIVGAESSGKTTLGKDLAQKLDGIFVPEYAREYLKNLNRPYTAEDLLTIARVQWERIKNIVADTGSFRNPKAVSTNELMLRLKGLLPVKFQEADSFKLADDYKNQNFSDLIILDGGMLNLLMWARIRYRIAIPIITEALAEDMTDLYILCRPLPSWENDPLREAPLLLDRVWIYNQYLHELTKSKLPFIIWA
ncbi:MAG: ATP-binding protein [Bacteroidota bacterium]|nr:ATP-binding protein [Bacteroidota bacterium]